MNAPETNAEWYVYLYYDILRIKNENAYQETGDPKYDRAAYKCSRICNAIRAKDAAVEKLTKDSYTKEEVIKLLEKAVWWS